MSKANVPYDSPQITEVTLSDLKPMSDDENARMHNPRNIGMIVDSLQEVGSGRSLLVDENNKIIAGNGTYDAAAEAGLERVWIVDAPADVLVARRRSDFTSEEQKTRAALYDNRTAEVAEWRPEVMRELRSEGLTEGMWTDGELDSMLHTVAPIPDATEQEEPELPAEHMVEIYCTAAVLDDILPTLERWRTLPDVKIDIS